MKEKVLVSLSLEVEEIEPALHLSNWPRCQSLAGFGQGRASGGSPARPFAVSVVDVVNRLLEEGLS